MLLKYWRFFISIFFIRKSSSHLQKLLLSFFRLNKSAAKPVRLLTETNREVSLSGRICCEQFHNGFNNGDVEDTERGESLEGY